MASNALPNILLAEKSRMSQLIAKFFFIGLGCQLDIATSGWQALQKINTTDYDLILMSMTLPDIDACAVSSMIRNSSRSCKQTPIIALSNRANTEECEKACEAGMSDYYSMPLTEQACQTIINEHLIAHNFCTAQGQ